MIQVIDMKVNVDIPIGISNDFEIVYYTNETTDNNWQAYLSLKDESHDNYTVLLKAGCNQPIMQDSEAEYNEHQWLWDNATGDVLIGGLGIGLVNQVLIDNPNITSVTIIENSQDVIDLVWEHCSKDERFTLIQENIETWEIPTDSSWDIAWFDTWLVDNSLSMREYKTLINNKYSPFCNSIRVWN